MKLHGLANELQSFFAGFPHNRAAGKIWHVGTETVPTFFDDYDVSHLVRALAKAGASPGVIRT
jgi:hypothetical protein